MTPVAAAQPQALSAFFPRHRRAGTRALFRPNPDDFNLVCGALDVGRQKNVTVELIEKYFMGNGILTWLLSPINLLADLLSYRNKLVYRLEDLPARPSQRDRDFSVREFVANGDRIKEHVAKKFGQSKRCMLTFKWFAEPQSTELKLPAFEQEFRHIKTIAIFSLSDAPASVRRGISDHCVSPSDSPQSGPRSPATTYSSTPTVRPTTRRRCPCSFRRYRISSIG